MANSDRNYTSITNTDEPLLSIDKYNRPLTVSNEDAAVLLITRLILLEPGTFQTHPDCGVGIVSMFRHSLDIKKSDIEKRIKSQINTYLPMFTAVEVTVEIDNTNKSIKIYVTSDQLHTIIPIATDTGRVMLDNMRN